MTDATWFIKKLEKQYGISLDGSKLKGLDLETCTIFEVAERLLPKNLLIKWFEQEIEDHKPLVLKYNRENYERLLAEDMVKLEELKRG